MDTFLITFQLKEKDDYSKVADRLRGYPKWARVMENVWIIKSDAKLTDIREGISSIIAGHGGSVMVVKINSSAWGTYSVSKDVTNWMKDNI